MDVDAQLLLESTKGAGVEGYVKLLLTLKALLQQLLGCWAVPVSDVINSRLSEAITPSGLFSQK
jgi:hypothetical protein